MILAALLATVFAHGAADAEAVRAAQANARQACESARRSLEDYIAKLPAACATDADCSLQYLSADSCAAPYGLQKRLQSANDPRVRKLQDAMRTACAPLWEKRPACEPLGGTPGCRKHRCLDVSHLPPEPAPPPAYAKVAPKSPYAHGRATASCAPDDGPAVTMVLSPNAVACGGPAEGPQIQISLWERGVYDKLKPGAEFVINGGGGWASLCPDHGFQGCDMFRNFHLKVLTYEKGKSLSGKFEGDTKSGAHLPRQDFEAVWCVERVFCG